MKISKSLENLKLETESIIKNLQEKLHQMKSKQSNGAKICIIINIAPALFIKKWHMQNQTI